MMIRSFFMFVCVGILVCHVAYGDSPFVVSKKRMPSGSKLKEQYGQELADTITMIPALHKKMAAIQEELMQELLSLLENDTVNSKTELSSRINGVHELKEYLEGVNSLLTKHAGCTKKPLKNDCPPKK